ncbi:MAG TPA: hypothetical protein VMT10_12040, partial [Solirubrobacteraceae bacterium]|nr:hypothetical protein [Solirubrobacteraceae bacterium]
MRSIPAAPRTVPALVVLLAGVALWGAPRAHAATKTTWLCSPSLKRDPCRPGLATTEISPTGQVLGTAKVSAARRPTFDCF